MTRRILVVGGAGLIGGAAALHLADQGHVVTIAGRNAPKSAALENLPFVAGSFVDDDFSDAFLSAFDTLVFAAGNDLRQLPPGADEWRYFNRTNSIGVPAFFRRARDAGMKRAVYVGSYYPELVPQARIQASGYLTSRLEADKGVRALASPDFVACTLQAPFTIGFIEGVRARQLEAITAYCMRLIEPAGPRYAPPGGANFMSIRSFAQGVAGAIERGEPGRSYLMGDENWSYAEYFNHFLIGLGSDERATPRDEPNPVMPDASLFAGRGTVVSYEPDPDSFEKLGVQRHDAAQAIHDMVPNYARLAREDYLR